MRHFIFLLSLLTAATAVAQQPPDARELAIARGLKWLAEHQYANGGWNFDHTKAPNCEGKCDAAGDNTKSVNAATAMGVLPFLWNNITHKDGAAAYKQTVYRGLQFLVARQKPDGSYCDGDSGMVGHALATICLAEAYAKTKDRSLRKPAQKAIDFIVASQNPDDGGWSTEPGKPSDTVTTGWQLLALRLGYAAYLRVPPATPNKAMRFLDSVWCQDYTYRLTAAAEDSDAGATAAALVARMYYGWDLKSPGLNTGMAWLRQRGPSAADLGYDYFATLAMRLYGDTESQKDWETMLENGIINSQQADKSRHDFGSWHTPDAAILGLPGGGRMAQTAISLMTLQMLYNAPIYKWDAETK